MYYIRVNNNETIDEFPTRKQAQLMLIEYRISDKFNTYTISTQEL